MGSRPSSTSLNPNTDTVIEDFDDDQRLASLESLPPELLLRLLSYLDAESLCAAMRASRALWAVGGDASLWRRLGLTVCARPWPPRPPQALRSLRVCSYRWPSARHGLRALAWLDAGGAGLRSLQRLELVGRNLDTDTLRACVRLCPGVHELSLLDVRVQDAWMQELSSLKDLHSAHLDWLTEMSYEQMLELSVSCPSLHLCASSPRPTAAARAAILPVERQGSQGCR